MKTTSEGETIIGWTIGDLDTKFEDVCNDCINDIEDTVPRHPLIDERSYGDFVPYPQCDRCGVVIER